MVKNKLTLTLSILFLVTLFLANINMVSSANWDNWGVYEEEINTMFIRDLGGTEALVTRITPHLNKVPRGCGILAEFDYISIENIKDPLVELELYDRRKGMVRKNKDIEYKVRTFEWENKTDWNVTCIDSIEGYVCEDNNILGYHSEEKEVWNDLENDILKEGLGKNTVTRIGLWGCVEEGESTEWIMNIAGVRIFQWSIWEDAGLQAGLLAYYSNNETTGDMDDYRDLGTGAVTGGIRGLPGVFSGENGTNASFFSEGTGYVTSNNTLGPGTEYSISFWYNTYESFGQSEAIMSHSSSNLPRPIEIRQGYENDKIMFCYGGTGGQSCLIGTSDLINDTWYHFTMISNSTGAFIYRDGTLETSNTDPKTPTWAGNLIIGSRGDHPDSAQSFFDEVVVHNRTLTYSEIQNLSSGITPWTEGGGIDITITSPTNTNYTTTTIPLNITNSSEIETCFKSINEGSNSTYVINATFTGTEGKGNVSVWCNGTDTSADVDFVNFTIDTLGPSINIIHPENGQTYNQTNQTLNISVSDLAGVNFTLYDWNGTNYTYTTPIEINYTEGSITLVSYSEDNLGNANINSTTFTIDTIGSGLTITLLTPNNGVNQTTRTFNFKWGVNGTQKVEVQNTTLWIDNQPILTNSSGIKGNYTFDNYLINDSSSHTWKISSYNNESSQFNSSQYSFSASIFALNVTAISPIDSFNSTLADIDFECTANETYQVENLSLIVDGLYLENVTTPGANIVLQSTETIADGSHEWYCEATSDLGTRKTENRTLRIDIQAPVINVTSPSGIYNLLSQGDSLDLNWTVSDINLDSCWYEYDGLPGTSSSNTDLTGGFIDENWGTSSPWQNGYMNYSVPEGIDTGIWKLKYFFGSSEAPIGSHTNLTVDLTDCIAVDNEVLNFIYNTSSGTRHNIYCNGILLLSYETLVFCVGSCTERYYRQEAYFGKIENKSINCTENSTNLTYVLDINNLTFYANDTIGNVNSFQANWTVLISEINQTFSAETLEGSTEDFLASIIVDSAYTIQDATLHYDTLSTTGEAFTVGYGNLIRKLSQTVPSATGTENKTFYWTITLDDDTEINLTAHNQTVSSFDIDNCTTYNHSLFTFTEVDEELQTIIGNSEIEYAITIYTLDREFQLLNLSGIEISQNPIQVCLSRDLPNSSSYSLDAVIRYTAPDYSNEYYNIADLTLINSTYQNITLYSLNISDSTDFQLTFTGSDFLQVENALVFVERQYIQENNTFKTVELPKTDYNGQTVLHLVRNDVVYNIIITKDGEILGTFENLIAFCDDFTIGDCNIELNAFDSVEQIYNYEEDLGIIVTTPEYNETTSRVTVNFLTYDGSNKEVRLEVTRNDIFGNRSICNATLISSGGTLTCSIDPNIDESVLKASIYSDDLLIGFSTVKLDSTSLGPAGLLIMFVMAMSFVFMFSGSKTGVLFSILLTLAGSIGLGLISTELIGLGASGLWLIVIIVIGIYKLNASRQN